MKPTRLHAKARRELREAALYYEVQQPGVAERWLLAFETAVQRICTNPDGGRPAAAGRARQYRVQSFPYTVIFSAVRTISTSSPSRMIAAVLAIG